MIDSHLHLDDEKFDGLRNEIIENLQNDGLDFVINNSCDLESMQKGVELATQHDKIFATVGMHPHTSKFFDDNFERQMIAFASHPKVVAVGEIGLDYYYDLSERSVQRDVFARQLEIADKLHLPVTLHVRDAYGDAWDVLRAQKKFLNNGVLWHCYSGSAEFARQMAKEGHYFAFGGAITFKNANKGEVLRAVPLDRILSETDSPYMAPVPLRGTTNKPANVALVVKKLAELREISVEEAENALKQNTLRLFAKIENYLRNN